MNSKIFKTRIYTIYIYIIKIQNIFSMCTQNPTSARWNLVKKEEIDLQPYAVEIIRDTTRVRNYTGRVFMMHDTNDCILRT